MNALQRRYFAWAAPHYARMPPALRHEVECLDRWLYSRAGLRFWAFVAAAVASGIAGLLLAGVQWMVAVPGGLVAGGVVIVAALSAWLQPERYAPSKLLRFAGLFVLLSYLGAVLGFVGGQLIGHGNVDLVEIAGELGPQLRRATPAMLLLLVTFVVLLWSVAAVRRFRLQKEMEILRRAQESDAIARQLAEARLKLLQGQIQPHFIFNTLAAVQHWVDESDSRAGPLLRALTSFLRGSTDLLAEGQVAFATELDTVRHYLSIMEARLGDRLRCRIVIDERAAVRAIPSGILLTLVENAIEHGISPSLHGGTLDVIAAENERDWTLRVVDDGAGPGEGWTEGVGLRNCRERLEHRFGQSARLTLERRAPGAEARVRIDVAAFG